jgi:hypothetical protein
MTAPICSPPSRILGRKQGSLRIPNVGVLLDLFNAWMPEDEIRKLILVDNPARLYRFNEIYLNKKSKLMHDNFDSGYGLLKTSRSCSVVWGGGISPQIPHRTGRDPFNLPGSCQSFIFEWKPEKDRGNRSCQGIR